MACNEVISQLQGGSRRGQVEGEKIASTLDNTSLVFVSCFAYLRHLM